VSFRKRPPENSPLTKEESRGDYRGAGDGEGVATGTAKMGKIVFVLEEEWAQILQAHFRLRELTQDACASLELLYERLNDRMHTILPLELDYESAKAEATRLSGRSAGAVHPADNRRRQHGEGQARLRLPYDYEDDPGPEER